MSSLSYDKKEKLQQFKTETKIGNAIAQMYLERCEWNVLMAVDEYDGEVIRECVESKTSTDKELDQLDAINEWFDTYADPEEEELITEDGILKFCEDINVDPQDILILAVAWVMNAAYMCAFTRQEWCRGMKRLRCRSAADLKQQLPRLRRLLDRDVNWKHFYNFCFNFAKEPGQKSLNLEIAIPMWEILLRNHFPTQTAAWVKFLRTTTPCKGITRDTWDLLLEFFIKVQDSYDKYDENEAWPVLIDDFMMWQRCQQAQH